MTPDLPAESHIPREKQLDIGTWGVFFVWMGIAFLTRLPWGAWLVGVGAIVIGKQMIRMLLAMRVEIFWIVAGILFILGGASQLLPFSAQIPLIPLVFILAGAGLLAKALSRWGRHPTPPPP